MADTPHIAGIALRTSQAHWDAGLHGEAEGSEVQVGLAIDGETGSAQRIGLWVETERLGRLALALDVPPSGAAQLQSISHARLTRGPLVPGVAAGAAEAKKLESGFEAARAQLRDDAAKYEAAISALKKELEEARADLSRGQDERRRGQAELDAMRTELSSKGDTSAEMVRAMAEAQAAHEATQKDLEDTRSQVRELRAQIARKGEAQEAVEKRCHQLEAEAKKATEQIAELEKQAAEAEELKSSLAKERTKFKDRNAELSKVREALEKLKKDGGDKAESLSGELAQAKDALEKAKKDASKTESLTGELSRMKITLEQAQQDVGQIASLTGELERLRVDLEAARAEAAQHSHAPDVEVALQAEQEKSARHLLERDEAREIARELKRAATQALAERDEARSLARSLHQQRQSTSTTSATGEVPSLRAQLQSAYEDKQLLETRLIAAQKQIELERKRAMRLAAGQSAELVTDEHRLSDVDPSRLATATHGAYVPQKTDPNMPAAPALPPKGKKP
jgi:DNA repair exonuclease SbcCD ATPase subunit